MSESTHEGCAGSSPCGAAAGGLPTLTPGETARYSRHIILPQIGLDGQRRLRGARVLVIGMGGLGSPASLYLAAAGVGTLGLAEFDRVEAHNLQRQVIHDDERVGTPKLDSARDRLHALNPGLAVEEHPEGVTLENAVELFSRYDVIVDGTDNFPTRYLNNDAAFFARRPLVYGSIFQFEGQVAVFDPAGGGPCYRCLFPKMPEPGTVPNCEEAGVFGALCGVVGSIQAMEAIKLIVGVGEPLRGKLLVGDALGMQFRLLNLKRDPNCPLCGDNPAITRPEESLYTFSCAVPRGGGEGAAATSGEGVDGGEAEGGAAPIEIDVAAAKAWLEGEGAPFLLDVREPFEADICRIPGSVNIPMSQVPEKIEALPRDRPILIHCHHGMRSMNVTQFLRSKGFADATNLGGGIDRWAAQLDPEMQRY